MSMSHEKGAVLYVVSRSGKVLGSDDRSRRFTQDDYFEGELEGWIFWGSKRTSGSSGSKRVGQETSPPGSHGKGFVNGSRDTLGRTSRRKRIPFVAWGDELASLKKNGDADFESSWAGSPRFEVMSCCSERGRRPGEGRKDGDAEFGESLSESARSQAMSSRSERWDRMEQNLKIGLAQLAILHKWEAGTRELAARWVAWLLKMLRKARPHLRPLQHLLFTMCAAVLPVICRSLVRESWTQSPDPEIWRCVDIFCKALEKSYACFSPIQWEILEEKIVECRKLRLKIASLLLKKEGHTGGASVEKQESLGSKAKKQEAIGGGLLDAPRLPSKGAPDPEPHHDTKDENLSNSLVQREGVPALVRRALREKLFTPRAKWQEGRVSGGSETIVSLLCPLSGTRVKVPARGRSCSHRASFDLQAYLEVRAKDDAPKNNATHLRKKQKMETTWCCPICGSDATWPQIIVDRVLLRILEVLPENMRQVCLLPNGRWRVVWSPVVEGLGKTDAGSANLSVHALSRYAVNTEARNFGQARESNMDAVKDRGSRSSEAGETCRCETDWHGLDWAFRSWREGIELLKGGESSRQRDGQVGERTLVANWDGDKKPEVESVSAVCKDQRTSGVPGTTIKERASEIPGTTINLAGEGTHCSGSTGTQALICPQIEERPSLSGQSGKLSKSGNVVLQNCEEEVAIQDTQHDCVVMEALMEAPFVFGETGGMYARMRVGQHKARRKQMAKKT